MARAAAAGIISPHVLTDGLRTILLEIVQDLPSLRICSVHDDFLIVEKPAQVLIHPTRPDGTRTLWHQIQEAFPEETLSLINRLDRETSGLVLVSRHREAASELGKMTMRREIHKEYFAICLGETPVAGTVDQPLDRIGKRAESVIYLKQGIHPEGYPARTHYRRLALRRHPGGRVLSLLEIRLETGRLHQIRVHLASLGHPVVGDKIYGPDENCYLNFIRDGWTEELAARLWLPRHALHACRLGFNWKGRERAAETALPPDLQEFWDGLEEI